MKRCDCGTCRRCQKRLYQKAYMRSVRAREGKTPRVDRMSVIQALYRNGMPIQAIADKLGITPEVTTSRIYRARKRGQWPEELRRKR